MSPAIIALSVLFLSGGLWFARRRSRPKNNGLYKGLESGRQLVSWEYGVTGQPDTIIDYQGTPVPVLVKHGLAPTDSAHDSHIAQVLVYCLLVHQTTNIAPPHGVIRYADRTFEVDYNEPAVVALLDLADEIRTSRQSIPNRSHDSRQRCFACRHNKNCDDTLL